MSKIGKGNWFKINWLLIIQTIGGLAALGLSIYFGFYYENKSKLTYEVLSNSSVFSVQENINQLKITYGDKTIDQSVEEINLITVRLKNDGNRDIKTTDYYKKSNFGFSIKNASIIEKPELLAYSKEFFKENLKITYSNNKVTLSQLPLNENDYYTIKILVVNESESEADILPLGNISNGVTTVEKVYENERTNGSNFNLKEFITFVSIIFILLLSMYLLGIFRKWKKWVRKKRFFSAYLRTLNEFTDNTRWLMFYYMEERNVSFIKIRFILEKPDVLFSILNLLKKTDGINEDLNSDYPELKDYETSLFFGDNLKFLKKLVNLGIIRIDYEKEEIAIAKNFKNEFDSFTDYLIENESFDLIQDLEKLKQNVKNKYLLDVY